MALAPLGTRGVRAVGQAVDDPALFAIQEQRAVATGPPQRASIPPEDRHRRCRDVGRLGPGRRWILGCDHPEHGGAADAHTQQASYAFCAAASYQEPACSAEVDDPHRFAGTGL
ncbi:MAG TPA: hypothetical protein VGS80_14075 [Ktedonobacterales bacterium]|nr:hypothetical protein [Ktedonobacterales bacterium]